jgi:DNA-directed RNA polymerase subunit RPC12/RpoP
MDCEHCGYGPMLTKRDIYGEYAIVTYKCALCGHSHEMKITGGRRP